MVTHFVLATHNRHKVEEFRDMLSAEPAGLRIDAYDGPVPVESGVTFAENALIKARAASQHSGRPSFADDSGLCVDVMNGAPGIFSARWAGAARDDSANRALLLEQLDEVPDDQRTAHYVCAIAVVFPPEQRPAGFEEECVVEGRWFGTLTRVERGTNGFGYDPIFLPVGSTLTAAELDPHVKNALSHRARALTELQETLARLR